MKLIELIFLLILFSFTLGELGRIPVASGINLLPADFLIPVMIILWLSISLAVKRKITLPPLFSILFMFFLVALLSLANALRIFERGEVLSSSLFLARWVEYVFLYVVGFDLVKNLPGAPQRYSNFLIFIGILIALAGFLQLQIIPDFSTIAQEGGWDPHQNRVLSTFFDPNFVGFYFTLTLVLIFSKFSFAKDKLLKLFLMSLWLVVFAALVLTFSRSAYLAFGVAFASIGVIKTRKMLPVLIVVAVASYFFVPGVGDRINNLIQGDLSSQARVTSWQNAFEIVHDYPVLGVGFNTYRFAQIKYGFLDVTQEDKHSASGTDSSLLLVLATTGIIGLVTYLILFGRIIYLSWIRRFSPYGFALFISMIALLVDSQFINSVFFPQVMGWMWALTALSLGEGRV